MTAELDGARPQDAGRRHRARGRPSPATVSLLLRYQGAMRGELEAILGALEARKAGLLEGLEELAIPLDDQRRDRLWDRAVKLGRELGTEVDPTPDTPAIATPTRARRRRVALGPD